MWFREPERQLQERRTTIRRLQPREPFSEEDGDGGVQEGSVRAAFNVTAKRQGMDALEQK